MTETEQRIWEIVGQERYEKMVLQARVATLEEALLDIERWTKPIGSPGMDGEYGGQLDGRGNIGRVFKRARAALEVTK